jgi:beta-lactamase regulating signal transducer with metallopeptidase domain
MNDVGLTFFGAAARVTLLALAAVPVYAAASRRGPRAGAAAATAGLAGCVALSLLAFCPLPDWWAWRPAAPGRAALAAADDSPPPAVAEPGPARGTDVAALVRWLFDRTRETTTPPSRPAGHWADWVATAALLGAGLGVLRLALGLGAVARWRRRSRPVRDAALLRLAEGLRTALGCRRPVAVRESDEVTVPATAGWLRPLVLLPADWRAWGEGDLRAVLAHELAHVSRSDYLAGLLARLGVALHFYNPLAHWLAGRLRLEQELAADALGARLAGGRGPYLRALARLALRRDERPARPGRVFLSAGGTLDRRIQMLRTRTSWPERTPSWPGRAAAGLLLAAALGVSGLRGLAPPAEAAPPPEPSRPAAAAKAVPFDLSALPPDAKGVWAFRPAAFFAQPGMKKYAEQADEGLALLGKEVLHLDPSHLPHVSDIEQAVGTLTLGPDSQDKGRSSLMADLHLLRTTRDFDWKKLFAAALPKAEEVRTEHGSYFKVTAGSFLGALGGLGSLKDAVLCYHVADARTVVFGSEADMTRLLSGEKSAPPKYAWAAEWQAVERDLIAVAYDGRDKGWLRQRRKPDDAAEAAITGVGEKASAFALGLSAADGLSVTAVVRCATAEETGQVRRRIGDLFMEHGALRAQLRAAGEDKLADGRLLRALLSSDWKVSQEPSGEGSRITWRCRSSLSFSALVEAMMSDDQAEESKPRAADRP